MCLGVTGFSPKTGGVSPLIGTGGVMGLDIYMSSSSGTGAKPKGSWSKGRGLRSGGVNALLFPLADGIPLLGVDGGKGG